MTFAEKIFDALKISDDARLEPCDKWAVSALALTVVALFLPNLATGTWPVDPYWIEIAQAHYPVKVFFHRALAEGRMPLWNHHIAFGYPSAAHSHSMFFYPLSIFFYVADFLPAMTAFLMAHLAIMAATMYGFARAMGAGAKGAMLGAVATAFCGYTMGMAGYVPVFAAMTWCPSILWLAAALYRKKSVFVVIALALVSSAQFFTGDLETMLYQWVFVLFAGWLFEKFEGGKIKEVTSFFGKFKEFTLFLKLLAMAGFGTFLLVSIQFLPLVELFSNSNRQAGFEIWPLADTLMRLPKLMFFFVSTFTMPVPLQEHLMNVSFLGIVFFIVGMAGVDKKSQWFVAILVVFCILNGIQHVSPLQRIFNLLPVLKGFRFPARLIFFSIITVSLVAAFGFDKFLKHNNKLAAKHATLLYVFAMAYAFVLFKFSHRATAAAIFAVISSAWLALSLLKTDRKYASAPILLLLLIDPFYLAISELPRKKSVDFAPYPEVQRLFNENQTGANAFSRSIMISRIRNGRFMSGEETAWGGYTPGGSYSIYMKRFRLYFSLLAPPAFVFDASGEKIVRDFTFDYFMNFYSKDLLDESSLPWLKLGGVRYLLADGDGYKFCGEGAPYKIISKNNITVCESENTLPRAFFAYEPIVFRGYEDVFSHMRKNPGVDFRRSVLLDSVSEKEAAFQPNTSAAAPVLAKYSNDYAEIRVAGDTAGYLVFTDNYYPGWEAEVDGVARKILPANGLFRAVKMSSGEKSVVMRYRPASYRIGQWSTLTALFGMLSIAVAAISRRKSR